MPDGNLVSAYHNYLIDGKLRMGFSIGDPEDPQGFFFVAHPVSRGEQMPVISGRFFERDGGFVLQMERNSLVRNPHGISLLETTGGWTLVDVSLQALFSVEVRSFDNCHMTMIRGTLFNHLGAPVLHGDDRGLRVMVS
ncbi:MAG: hypothetical protein ACUVXD_08385 [Thermodesulfobacteriota bacterium]